MKKKNGRRIARGQIVRVMVVEDGKNVTFYIGEIVYHNPNTKTIEISWPSSFDCLFKKAPGRFENVDRAQIKVISGPMIMEELGQRLHELRREITTTISDTFANRRLAI